jgi:hypothetical protein
MQWCLSTAYLISVPLGQCQHVLTTIFAKVDLKTTSYHASSITWDPNTLQISSRMS